MGTELYDDGLVRCEADQLIIRRYYFPWGSKRIPYASIIGISILPMTSTFVRWRIWGSNDFQHWWHLDTRRPKKSKALVIRTSRRTLPTITPENVAEVEAILRART